MNDKCKMCEEKEKRDFIEKDMYNLFMQCLMHKNMEDEFIYRCMLDFIQKMKIERMPTNKKRVLDWLC